MLATLPPWHARIVAHLTHDGLPANEAIRLADVLASESLIERVQLTFLDGDDWRDLSPSLHAAGFIDRLEIEGEIWWSPTLPRKLAASWTIWPIHD